MLHSVRYTCHAALLPVIEGAFAANSYIVDISPRKYPNGASVLVLQRDATIVLLIHLARDPVGEIEIWGSEQSAAISFLESLPIEIRKQSSLHASDTDGLARAVGDFLYR